MEMYPAFISIFSRSSISVAASLSRAAWGGGGGEGGGGRAARAARAARGGARRRRRRRSWRRWAGPPARAIAASPSPWLLLPLPLLLPVLLLDALGLPPV